MGERESGTRDPMHTSNISVWTWANIAATTTVFTAVVLRMIFAFMHLAESWCEYDVFVGALVWTIVLALLAIFVVAAYVGLLYWAKDGNYKTVNRNNPTIVELGKAELAALVWMFAVVATDWYNYAVYTTDAVMCGATETQGILTESIHFMQITFGVVAILPATHVMYIGYSRWYQGKDMNTAYGARAASHDDVGDILVDTPRAPLVNWYLALHVALLGAVGTRAFFAMLHMLESFCVYNGFQSALAWTIILGVLVLISVIMYYAFYVHVAEHTRGATTGWTELAPLYATSTFIIFTACVITTEWAYYINENTLDTGKYCDLGGGVPHMVAASGALGIFAFGLGAFVMIGVSFRHLWNPYFERVAPGATSSAMGITVRGSSRNGGGGGGGGGDGAGSRGFRRRTRM